MSALEVASALTNTPVQRIFSAENGFAELIHSATVLSGGRPSSAADAAETILRLCSEHGFGHFVADYVYEICSHPAFSTPNIADVAVVNGELAKRWLSASVLTSTKELSHMLASNSTSSESLSRISLRLAADTCLDCALSQAKLTPSRGKQAELQRLMMLTRCLSWMNTEGVAPSASSRRHLDARSFRQDLSARFRRILEVDCLQHSILSQLCAAASPGGSVSTDQLDYPFSSVEQCLRRAFLSDSPAMDLRSSTHLLLYFIWDCGLSADWKSLVRAVGVKESEAVEWCALARLERLLGGVEELDSRAFEEQISTALLELSQGSQSSAVHATQLLLALGRHDNALRHLQAAVATGAGKVAEGCSKEQARECMHVLWLQLTVAGPAAGLRLLRRLLPPHPPETLLAEAMKVVWDWAAMHGATESIMELPLHVKEEEIVRKLESSASSRPPSELECAFILEAERLEQVGETTVTGGALSAAREVASMHSPPQLGSELSGVPPTPPQLGFARPGISPLGFQAEGTQEARDITGAFSVPGPEMKAGPPTAPPGGLPLLHSVTQEALMSQTRKRTRQL